MLVKLADLFLCLNFVFTPVSASVRVADAAAVSASHIEGRSESIVQFLHRHRRLLLIRMPLLAVAMCLLPFMPDS